VRLGLRLAEEPLGSQRVKPPPRLGDTVVALQDKAAVAVGDLDGDSATIEEGPDHRTKIARRDHRILKVTCINTA
jgi:hypothetical protein